jgi:A/G-specific adenine glycosylase
MKKVENSKRFAEKLLDWYDQSQKRDLPWKATQNPYHIWLSEIILQQTRVEQGKPYYLRFIEKYPTLKELAAAEEAEVMKIWQGLGYYSRARNMLETAKYIDKEHHAIFPNQYDQIRKLKGIGDYTAAAIASFAFNLPHAVVDGNVFRVLSRCFGISTAIDSGDGKKTFTKLANSLLSVERPADFNQAMMDLGAVICTPASPKCKACPFAGECQAAKNNSIAEYPVKSKKLTKKNRYFYYFVWKGSDNQTILKKRTEKDIWRGLYDFPMMETDKTLSSDKDYHEIWSSEIWKSWNGSTEKPKAYKISPSFQQVLTHQNILVIFVEIIDAIPIFFENHEQFFSTTIDSVNQFALPKTINSYVQLNYFSK